MDETVDLAGLIHEDKCRYWDDEEFCDCGAVDYELLKRCKAERDKYRTALERIINERGEDYGDADYQSIWKAVEAAKQVLSPEAP